MKKKMTNKLGVVVMLLGFSVVGFSSCSDDDEPQPIREGIEKAELTLTEISGEAVYPHGDHFHGLNGGVEGEKVVIAFNEEGIATKNGHLHLEADAVYKIELKAWDYEGREVQNSFIENKTIADSYKAFLIGGDFKLNPDSETEEGAIFQPREQTYADESAVDGKYETTGILSYFIVGHENEGSTKEVSYVLRKLNEGVKAQIERTDWNREDYKTAFPGENVLELKFEIHAEHGHDH